MSKWARRRDACEKEIIKALKAAGASVDQLDCKGIPDLLVGYQGKTYLLECKDPEAGQRNSRDARTGKGAKNPLGLRDSQWAWWCEWQGTPAIIVTNATEALLAIGYLLPG